MSGRAGREVQHIFVVCGKLLSKSLLFDMALAEACTAADLVDSAGKATITAHRFQHTIGTQLADGGARRWRRDWQQRGSPWVEADLRPDHWDSTEQLAHLPDRVR